MDKHLLPKTVSLDNTEQKIRKAPYSNRVASASLIACLHELSAAKLGAPFSQYLAELCVKKDSFRHCAEHSQTDKALHVSAAYCRCC